MKNLTLSISFILFSLCSFAQYAISGCVISQADTKPVANASVFLSNATIGDHTEANGTFKLTNVKAGKYNLVVSIVGFDPYNQTITVTSGDIDLQTITIYPKTIAIGEVKIKASAGKDSDRPRYFEGFKSEFLGTSDLARECKILNPELLDFNYDAANNILTASSVDFLVIRNDALGYKIKYLLKDFTLSYAEDGTHAFSYSGSVLFETLKGSPEQQKEWQRRRQEVYEGSQMHFLRSAIAGTMEQDGFRVFRLPANPQRPADSLIQEKLGIYQALKKYKIYRDSLNYWTKKADLPKTLDKLNPVPLKKEDFITGPDKQGVYSLNFNGDGLFITYNKYHNFNRSARSNKLSDPENKDNTLVSFDRAKLLFDKNGSVINPAGLIYDGVWMRGRVSTLLPLDYEPQQNKLTEVDSALLKNIMATVSTYRQNNIAEKAYLHFDKPYYAAGDTIYFKAYVTLGDKHELSGLSNVLHVDLIDANNKISQSIKLKVKDGIAWGDLALSPLISKGDYRIRAYTRWMQNEGSTVFFDQTLPIGSPLNNKVPESGSTGNTPTNGKPDLGFFPEAGSLVAGVRSKIAFKAVGANGLGIDVKGVVVDDENKEVASFTSSHLGMGYFYLTLSATKNYRAKVTYPNGAQDVVQLPKSVAKGISFAITSQAELYNINISCSKQWYQENKNKTYTLVIYSGGDPQSVTIKLENPEISIAVAKKEFHSGIAKATLFSASREPLCERLLFVQNNDGLKLNLSSDKNTYAARDKVGIKLNVTTSTWQPAPGYFSVAVINEDDVPVDENSESTIVNNLLLTSDLKGYIEQPDYYFTNTGEKAAADLDLVMLTHGYRRFEWERIFNNNSVVAYRPEKGLTIGGQIKFNGDPVQNGKVKLFSNTAGGLMLDTLSDASGRFVFDNLTFDDTTKFVIQARTAKDQKDLEVKPDINATEPGVAIKNIPNLKVANGLSAYVQNSKQFFDEQDKYGYHNNGYMLKEVVVKDKKTTPFEHSQNLNGKGNADQVITADWLENSGYTNLYDAVRAKATSIIFTQNHQLRSNRTIVGTDPHTPPDYMVIIIDGTPEFRDNQPKNSIKSSPLDELSASDIESVEIVLGTHGGAIYGPIASGGAVIVTTKRGRRINNYYKEAPGVITIKPVGFYKARQFYAPKYDHPMTNNTMKDLRSTIYWNPDIVTDKDGNASFSYFNADGKGTYRIVIEGIDAEGNLGRQVYRYKVE
ncbi:MAG: hypothetical protein JWR09_3300 [Mucilaginibacter sp.]|nr:hypothetical protein [Mucilaginibacter sp.]